MPEFSGPNGGNPFDDGENLSGVAKVVVRHGKYIDGIQLFFRDGRSTGFRGGSGGALSEFVIDDGDFLESVNIWSGWGTDAIQFHTRNGNISQKYGGNGGGLRTEGGRGLHVIGMSGRSGALLDRVDFKFRQQPSDSVGTIILNLVPLFEVHGGSSGHETRTYTTKKGCRTVHSSSLTKTTISADASGKVNAIAWSAEAHFMSQYTSFFTSALLETSEETTVTREVYIDFSQPCFYYYAVVNVYTTGGGAYDFSNPAVVQSSTKLTNTRYVVHAP